MANVEKDRLLDHDADGIREYDNDLPKWWLYGFYFTIVMSLIYMFYYHVYTGPDWNVLWYRERGQAAEYEADVTAAKASLAAAPAAEEMTLTLLTDEASLKQGEAMFNSTTSLCYTCHRADLGGVVGPNLTDDYWIHGGTLKDVVQSIRTGYPDKGMLPYGSNNRLSNEDLLKLASFVMSKRGSNPPAPKAIDPAREILVKPVAEGEAEAHDHEAHEKAEKNMKEERHDEKK